MVLAGHLAFYRACKQQGAFKNVDSAIRCIYRYLGRSELDELLAKFLKDLPANSFSYMLDLLSEALSSPNLVYRADLVHVHALLLQNAPEGQSPTSR